MWNSYFDAMIYLNSESKQPAAARPSGNPDPEPATDRDDFDMQSTAARAQLGELLKYTTIIISSIQLLVMYPFFQKVL